MMMTLGIALYGTTVLLPQYLQTLMGYTAQQSGMALSPGGLVVMCLMPFVGRMIGKVDSRLMIGFGFTVLAASLFYMTTHLYGGIDFRTAMSLRMFQSVGIAFLFVPINTLVYSGIPPEKNNSVSGIVNLSRNMGGDIGIALVTTLIARRAQVHQSNLASYTNAYEPAFMAKLTGITLALQHTGASATQAARQATAILYRQLVQQATTLAYIDTLKVLAVGTLAMIPLLLLTQRAKPSGGAPAAH
jgi:DHA2 family multidrug resistance protein